MKLPRIFQVAKQLVRFTWVRIAFARVKVVEKRWFAFVVLANRNIRLSYWFARGRSEEQQVRSVREIIKQHLVSQSCEWFT